MEPRLLTGMTAKGHISALNCTFLFKLYILEQFLLFLAQMLHYQVNRKASIYVYHYRSQAVRVDFLWKSNFLAEQFCKLFADLTVTTSFTVCVVELYKIENRRKDLTLVGDLGKEQDSITREKEKQGKEEE